MLVLSFTDSGENQLTKNEVVKKRFLCYNADTRVDIDIMPLKTYHKVKVVNCLGIKDTVTIKYMRQNKIFADAFNYLIYGGEQVIKPDRLEELDTKQVEVPYGGVEGAGQPVQKARDAIKFVTAMTDKRVAYLLLAAEVQSHIHYAMAVKNMVYDALQYAKQVEKAIASHKKSGDYKGVESDEFLSGFMKGDHLLPVVTLTLLFDPKAWDAPVSIHEMFGIQDERILAFIPNYTINLITPASIQDIDFRKFKTSLKEVLSFIKYSGDAVKLKELVEADKAFHHLGRNEVEVLNACVNAKLTMSKGEGAIDVCAAIQTLEERAEDKGRMNTLLGDVKKLVKNLGCSVERSMDILEIPENLRSQLYKMLD